MAIAFGLSRGIKSKKDVMNKRAQVRERRRVQLTTIGRATRRRLTVSAHLQQWRRHQTVWHFMRLHQNKPYSVPMDVFMHSHENASAYAMCDKIRQINLNVWQVAVLYKFSFCQHKAPPFAGLLMSKRSLSCGGNVRGGATTSSTPHEERGV